VERSITPSATEADSDKLTEVKEEIKYLFSLREQTHTDHISTYFPKDLEIFLQHSTQTQLQAYIDNYGKAIKLSIQQNKAASTAKTRNIFTYLGFQQIKTTAPTEKERPSRATTTSNTTTPDITDILAEAPPTFPPTSIPPPAPNEHPSSHGPTTKTTTPAPMHRRLQQTILNTLSRRRTIREITQNPQADPMRPANPRKPPEDNQINRDQIQDTPMQTHYSQASTSSIVTEDNTISPVNETRAPSPYKHSKWRTKASVREKFSQYFQKR
jgi:hypothetical protein